MAYKQLIHMEPEEVDEDSRVLYLAGWILDGWRKQGFHEGPRCLEPDEHVWVKTKLLRHPDGLWQFSDATIEAAISFLVAAHVSNGHAVNLNITDRLNQLKGLP